MLQPGPNSGKKPTCGGQWCGLLLTSFLAPPLPPLTAY